MTKGDDSFILIDLRSNEEYVEEHIIGAINVPAYKDRDNSDYGAVQRIISTTKQLQKDNPGKDLIVYCYSIPCMTGRKVGKILADEGIYVKLLGVGWNEWRYYWQLWNHPHEWNITNVEDYVISGSEPGIFDADITGTGCPIEGGLGC
jgi:rhodanese-related sulfurtransferase